MRTSDFDYFLPPERIAQRPCAERDASRLLVLNRTSGEIAHRAHFSEIINYLRPGDVLVLNDSRVIPARLRGRKAGSGGEIEILLLSETAPHGWWTLLRPGKRVRPGTRLEFVAPAGVVTATVQAKNDEGQCWLEFPKECDVRHLAEQIGEIPLPPYIERSAESSDRERYQTVFAREGGSVAAPTAGLHFTPGLLERISGIGVEVHHLTLHVGLGTFAPVKAESVEAHRMHEEAFELSGSTAAAVNRARAARRRVLAVGTTTVRVLESVAAEHNGQLVATTGRTRIFIYPPYRFQIVDGLLTNFHLPCSTLLMLVSAFAAPGDTHGRELILRAYAEAMRECYRFFSYGDAMLVL